MNFKSNKRKSTSFQTWKFFSLVLMLSLWGVAPFLQASTNTLPPENQRIIKGIVVDETNEPMVGVSIMEKGTTNGTITDINGAYQIKVNADAKLVFSYIGYVAKELASAAAVKVQLLPDSKQIDEVVVVGYANQSKKSVVGSIAQVSGETLKSKGGVANLSNALSGSIPGVTVMTVAGNPGGSSDFGGDPQILIRGKATWNNASPLILVDGMERNMNDVEINEIETFSVLKDASATAVFGVKGANGVILITTKRGAVGKPKVNIEISSATKYLSKVEKVLGSYDALLARNYALVHELALPVSPGWGIYYTPARALEMYKNQIDPEKYPSVDWQEEMLRDNAKSTKYGVNISGGTEFVKYFTSLAYTYDGDMLATENENTRGYSPEFRYDRYNFRTNLDFNLTKTTIFKVSLSGYFGKQQESGGSIHNMWYGVYKHSPTSVPRYSDGMYGSDEATSERFGYNSFRDLNTNGTKTNTRTSIISDFELNQKLDFITKGLSFRGRFSFDNYFATTGRNIEDKYVYTTKRYNTPTEEWQYNAPTLEGHGFDWFPTPLGYTSENPKGSATKRNLYYEASINYTRKFGKHNIGAMALFSREKFATGSSFPNMREDWVGRVTYDYDGRYLVEVNGAYNGSEKFGPEYKFDFFPSLALGWRLSEEEFIKEKAPFISNLKLKYSLGQVGNDRLSGVGQWPFVTSWVSGYPTGLGGDASQNFGYPTGIVSPYPVYREGVPGNPELHWEASTKQNIGAEFGLFKGLITGTFDYFTENRRDILVGSTERTIPEYVGGTAPAANLGQVKSHGMEIDLKIQKTFGKVNLWASYNWTEAINRIIKKEDPQLAPAYQKQAGYSIGQTGKDALKNDIAMQVVDHIITSWDDMYKGVMYESSTTNGNMLPGDYRMYDYNSDGFINGLDNIPLDYTKYPQNTYGFAFGADYKGIALMVQFYGNYNVSVNEGQLAEFDFNAPVIYKSLLDRSFTPEYQNSNADYRALQINRKAPNGNAMMYDASFLRLKTAELSYTLPKSWVKKVSMENVRIYANGNNLIFWSKLPIDVEGDDAEIKRYPNTKQINLGLNVTF